MNRQPFLSEGLPSVPHVQLITDQVASPEDLCLLASMRYGDAEAMMALLQRYHSSMVRFALIHLPDRVEAELVVKETWVVLLRNLDQFQVHHSLKIEIHRLLIHSIQSKQQLMGDGLAPARHLETAHTQDAHSQRFFSSGHLCAGLWAVPPRHWQIPQDPRVSQELRALIEQALERLPLDQREIITLCDIEGWSSSEVSTLLDLFEHQVRGLLHRARIFVRQVVEDYFNARSLFFNESQ